MKNTLKKFIQLTLVLVAMITSTHFVSAAENRQPVIETKTFPNGSSVTVTMPEGFSGKVFTSCYNGVCNSTSSPVTDKDISDLKERIDKQRKEMEDFFTRQQELFNEMFDNTWAWSW